MSKLVKKSIIKQACMALLIALIPLTVFATGLGKLNVFSSLGEPLYAEIELLSVSSVEMTTLTADLASSEQYQAQGIDKTAIQQSIKTSIIKKSDGSLVIQLTTAQAVTDPFLDMLIQVSWSDGQLSREYTLLLDPSEYSTTNIATPIVDTPKSLSDPSKVKETLANVKQPASKSSTRHSSGHLANSQKLKDLSLDGQSVTTVKGDTLIAVVGRFQVQDVNLDQLLLGVFKANSSAFIDGNMNRLKVGQILNIPSAETLQAISKTEARAEVHAQVSNWNAYTSKLADTVSHSETGEQSTIQQNGGKIITNAEDKAVPVSEGTRDVIKLEKTETDQSKSKGADSQPDASSSAQTATTIQDDIAAKANEIKETDEKAAALQKQIADMKQLLALKNKHLADVQNNAEHAQTNSFQFPHDLSEVDPVVFAVSGALIALFLSLFWLNRRKSQRALSLKDSVTDHGKTFTQTIAENNTDSAMLLNDFSASGPSLIDTHDVDQIVEAEVLLADGRQAQAEDILSDAIQKSPEQYDEMIHDLSSDEKVETPANKPLEMDLTEISLDFEALPSLDASALQAAPIPDAFNGDFSNMLKIDTKPKSLKSATQASTPKSKSVNKTSKESKTSNEESADVATKLELAAAYIDMEDKEGALALLAEAVKEGGPEQRARAQALIESLS